MLQLPKHHMYPFSNAAMLGLSTLFGDGRSFEGFEQHHFAKIPVSALP